MSYVYHWDSHHRFLASCLVGLLAFLGFQGHLEFPTVLLMVWISFALCYLILAWIVIYRADPYEARRNAKLQDASRTLLFVLVILGATVSLFAVWLLLASAKHLAPTSLALHVALSVVGVTISWALVHTIFTLRYAHHYYFDALSQPKGQTAGGVIFPGNDEPDYLDFAYFSFVVGMTCQVSDVQIASRDIRRLALVHGLVSFLFNTAIVAIFVNIVAGII